ncbi:MAG: hypothetical protein V9H26_10455 [Verrucomicrobiota bacterium]
MSGLDETRRERRDPQRRRIFADQQVQHRGVPSNRASSDAAQRTGGALARTQQQRLDRLHHNGSLQGDQILRLMRCLDPRDHVVPKADLLVKCPSPRQHFSRYEIHEQHHDSGCAHIHRKGRVTLARHKLKQRQVRIGHSNFKGFADLRTMLNPRPGGEMNRGWSGQVGATSLNGG